MSRTIASRKSVWPPIVCRLPAIVTLIHTLEKEGFQVVGKTTESPRAVIYGENIRFGLIERFRRVKPAPKPNASPYAYNPVRLETTGNLSIEVWNYYSSGQQKVWRDRENSKLEAQISEMRCRHDAHCAHQPLRVFHAVLANRSDVFSNTFGTMPRTRISSQKLDALFLSTNLFQFRWDFVDSFFDACALVPAAPDHPLAPRLQSISASLLSGRDDPPEVPPTTKKRW
jgi:hypothetical protein